MSIESQWYYARAGHQHGPVPSHTVRQLLAQGQLAWTDLVWCEGMHEWQPASSVAALARPNVVIPPAPAMIPPPAPQYAAHPDPRAYGAAPIPYYPSGQSYNGLAIAGFVLALTPLSIVGMILSLVALSGMKTSGNYEGRALAKAGVIIPIVLFSAALLFGCLWFTLVAAVLGMSGRG